MNEYLSMLSGGANRWAQFLAVSGVSMKIGCPEGLGPVVHGPSTKQTNEYTYIKKKKQ